METKGQPIGEVQGQPLGGGQRQGEAEAEADPQGEAEAEADPMGKAEAEADPKGKAKANFLGQVPWCADGRHAKTLDFQIANISSHMAESTNPVKANLLSRHVQPLVVSSEDMPERYICKDGGHGGINHGVESSFLDNVHEGSKQFFALPMEERQKYSRETDDAEGYGNDMVLSKHQTLDGSDRLYLFVNPEDKRKLKYWPESQNLCVSVNLCEYFTLLMK
ncbi:hypothetical protein RJ640_010072 [Escallonia rubra]|uniref:Non-haem dioxygenase N-terminal domain-containing protein n=1 Tax=Escallonia rubra TaxID=112253 RepID=A0AA88RX15_9ASTE|nr:hypothetical protein RJ640_010072 [Escallonia rubra]